MMTMMMVKTFNIGLFAWAMEEILESPTGTTIKGPSLCFSDAIFPSTFLPFPPDQYDPTKVWLWPSGWPHAFSKKKTKQNMNDSYRTDRIPSERVVQPPLSNVRFHLQLWELEDERYFIQSCRRRNKNEWLQQPRALNRDVTKLCVLRNGFSFSRNEVQKNLAIFPKLQDSWINIFINL